MNLVAAKVSSLIFGRRSEPTHVGCYEGSFMVLMRFKRKWKLSRNRPNVPPGLGVRQSSAALRMRRAGGSSFPVHEPAARPILEIEASSEPKGRASTPLRADS